MWYLRMLVTRGQKNNIAVVKKISDIIDRFPVGRDGWIGLGDKMWATDVRTVSDAYRDYQIILYRWIRCFGKFMGQDIFHENFKHRSYTTFVAVINLSLPILMFLTSYRFDGELGMTAGVLVIVGLKVQLSSMVKF